VSSKEATKQDLEHREFRAFAKQAGFTIVDGTLTSKPAPAPDIEVELVGRGWRAFELTDLNPATSHFVWNLMNCQDSPLTAHLNAMAPEDRKTLIRKYPNACITFGLNYDTQPPGKRASLKQALPEIFRWLMALPDDYEGDAFHYNGNTSDLDDVRRVMDENHARRERFYFLRQLYIQRTHQPSGIVYMTNAGGHIQRLVTDQVKGKLTKEYKSSHPMELLLTARRTIPEYPDDFREIKSVVDQFLPTSSFERVWLHASAINHAWLVGER
jgi:hypothetical protein